ncbi:MAG: hypothetical protein HPY51_00720 [Candidatus Omnitrophica bacterium]|nr:hypothetical protein [Candidatus Omnitrophota bacterium]
MILEHEIQELVWDSILRLEKWVDSNGWDGYDPYDIKSIPLYRYLFTNKNRSLILKFTRYPIIIFENLFPIQIRKLLGVKKHINPLAMALFAKSYFNLLSITGINSFREKAFHCLNWLEENASSEYCGVGWGHCFDWDSVVFFPSGTPFSTVSCAAGDAFWEAYKTENYEKGINFCIKICEHFLNDYRITHNDKYSICFSYSPLDDFCIHNSNLMIAEFLTRIGIEIGNNDYIDIGMKAAQYALDEQNSDGSIYYWGKKQNHNNPNHIDGYHSGFEIRCLYRMWKLTNEEKFKLSLLNYFDYYKNNLLFKMHNSVIPKIRPDRVYPIDIHACAEAILCNVVLSNDFSESDQLLSELLPWIIRNMQEKNGWFIYKIVKIMNFEYKISIPFIRWGQALMLLSLSEFMKSKVKAKVNIPYL